MKKFLNRVLIIICVIVFVFSAYNLIKIFLQYRAIEADTQEMIDVYVEDDDDPLKRVIDFDALLEQNPDVIGWLYIPNTNIDEVILKGENNDTYLRTDINHNSNTAGQLFIDQNNHEDFNDMSTIIYGHNMRNGSRFHDIRYYINEGQSYLEDHSNVYIYLPDGSVNWYKVVAAATIDDDSDFYNYRTNYDEYIDEVLKHSIYDLAIDSEPSPIVMLSTCHSSQSTKRNVAWAKLEENVQR